MKKYFGVVLFLIVTVICLSGCVYDLVIPESDLNSADTENNSTSGNQEDELGTGKGILKIYLTDAPGDYQEVNINISRIDGHIAGDGEEGEDKGSWVELKDWPGGRLVNLIELEDVASMLLASLELEPNKYTQLRIFLKEGTTLLLEGEDETVPLEIPSSANTGIKLNRPFEIIAGMITKLTIDFDAEKSVIKTGNGKYKMKPVISLSSSTYSAEELSDSLGSVSGSVFYYQSGNSALVGIGGANIELTGGAYIFTNTATTSEDLGFEGEFSLDNVPAGTYTLNVYAEDYDDYSESVEVTAGADTEVYVVLLAEEPGVISGSVIALGTALAIEGAVVSVELESIIYSYNSFTETDFEGKFSIGQLPVGSYQLTVSVEDYDDYDASGIAVTAGGVIDLGVIVLTSL